MGISCVKENETEQDNTTRTHTKHTNMCARTYAYKAIKNAKRAYTYTGIHTKTQNRTHTTYQAALELIAEGDRRITARLCAHTQVHVYTHSLTHSLTNTNTHSFIHSFLAHIHTQAYTCVLTHSLTHSFKLYTHSLTAPLLPRSLTHSIKQSMHMQIDLN